jgi:hypothetical protein
MATINPDPPVGSLSADADDADDSVTSIQLGAAAAYAHPPVAQPPSNRQLAAERRRLSVGEYLVTAQRRIDAIELSEKGLIVPGSPFADTWDIIMISALLFTTFVTPYDVALLDVGLNGLFAMNRLVDCVFIVDMYVNFHMIFQTDAGASVTNRSAIRQRYLRGWFPLDLITTLPYDMIGFLDTSGSGSLEKFRLVRLLRLLRLLRLMKASRVLQRWEFKLGIISRTLKAYKLLFTLTMSTHWIACAWALFATMEPRETYTWASAWIDNEPDVNPLCLTDQDGMARNGALRNVAADGAEAVTPVCYPVFHLYSVALHFAVMTVTSIGYGDVAPKNHSERLFGILLQLLAAVLWASVVAEIVAVTSAGDPVGELHRHAMDDLNQFMSTHDVEQKERFAVRRYLAFAKQAMRERSYKATLGTLPPVLVTKMQARPKFLTSPCQVTFMACASDSFCAALIIKLKCISLPPQAIVTTGETCYILKAGCLCADGDLVTSTARVICWGGNDFFLKGADRQFVCTVTLHAVTYVELHCFGQVELDILLTQFPLEAPKIRRKMLWATVFARIQTVAKAEISRRGGSPRSDVTDDVAAYAPSSQTRNVHAKSITSNWEN